MAWAFDIGWGTTGDQGIQLLYLTKTDTIESDVQHTLYPSLSWAHAPPSEVLLRPVPAMEANIYPIGSSLSSSDDLDTFPDFKLSSIRVYVNAFLQGIVFCFKNGQTRCIGDMVGVEGTIELEEERVFSVWLRQRAQHFLRMQLPLDVVCVDGIRVSIFNCRHLYIADLVH